MSDEKNVKVTPFDISPKFTLFRGHKGEKPGVKRGKKSAHLLKKHDINVIFREYVT